MRGTNHPKHNKIYIEVSGPPNDHCREDVVAAFIPEQRREAIVQVPRSRRR